MSRPIPLRNSCIALALLAGRAVNMYTSLLPNFLFLSTALLKNGPLAPLITLLNSLKSNSAPLAKNVSPSFANLDASNLPLVPSGIVYNTLLLVVANVSSKSQTLIPLLGLSRLFPKFIALSKFSTAFKDCSTVRPFCLKFKGKE